MLLDIPTMLSLTGGFEHANSGVIRAHTKAVTGLVLQPGSSILSSAMDGLVCTSEFAVLRSFCATTKNDLHPRGPPNCHGRVPIHRGR